MIAVVALLVGASALVAPAPSHLKARPRSFAPSHLTARPRSYAPVVALRAQAQQADDVDVEPLGVQNAVAAATLASLVAFAFGFAPGELGNPADVALVERLVSQPVPRPEEINELWFAIWFITSTT